jgi:hypothetical protein
MSIEKYTNSRLAFAFDHPPVASFCVGLPIDHGKVCTHILPVTQRTATLKDWVSVDWVDSTTIHERKTTTDLELSDENARTYASIQHIVNF